MRFSLVVPTIDRTEKLADFLKSLTEQKFTDFEVLIIDQNKNELIKDIIDNYEDSLDLKWLKIDARGASFARNVGIEHAKGAIITFPDDDCEYPKHLLNEVNNVFKNDQSLDGITIGTVDKNEGDSIIRLGKKQVLINKYNILKRCLEAGIFVRTKSIGDVRFDIKLGVGSYTPWWSDEGPDFILKLLDNNCKIEFHPELIFYHPNPVRSYDNDTILRSYKYGKGRGMFLKKNDYAWWFVSYNMLKYVVGITIGLFKMNKGMIRYFYWGLRGRLIGYFSNYDSY